MKYCLCMKNLWLKRSTVVRDTIKKELQKEIFEVFLEVKRVCEELDIKYFIMGGTALGAVRHGGFIPWDDDFDIGMTRENYERFISEGKEKLPNKLFLQNYKTEPHSPFYFSKVRKSGTKFIERYCKKLSIHQGIYIDIFPYDAIPDDEKEKRQYYKNGRKRLNWYIAKEVCGISTNPAKWKRILLECCRTLMHIAVRIVPKSVLYNSLDAYLQKYNLHNTKRLGYAGLPKIEVNRKDVECLEQIVFEGYKVSCPQNIEDYLSTNYGNYMELPPEEKRGGHDVVEISLQEVKS